MANGYGFVLYLKVYCRSTTEIAYRFYYHIPFECRSPPIFTTILFMVFCLLIQPCHAYLLSQRMVFWRLSICWNDFVLRFIGNANPSTKYVISNTVFSKSVTKSLSPFSGRTNTILKNLERASLDAQRSRDILTILVLRDEPRINGKGKEEEEQWLLVNILELQIWLYGIPALALTSNLRGLSQSAGLVDEVHMVWI